MLDKVKKNFYPKGRGIEDSALEDIKELISNLPLKRDLLIEYLHLIQDKYGQIRKKHLAALSKLLRIPLAESFEVATFYAHFDVIEDDSDSIQDLTIRVCDCLNCELYGSENLIKELKDLKPISAKISLTSLAINENKLTTLSGVPENFFLNSSS